jgi:peptidyl-prolyl cis-trans isomerase-like 3
MANNGPNTNGCQFFLIYSAQPHLNNMYTIFGQVRVRVSESVSVIVKL